MLTRAIAGHLQSLRLQVELFTGHFELGWLSNDGNSAICVSGVLWYPSRLSQSLPHGNSNQDGAGVLHGGGGKGREHELGVSG